MEKLIALGKEFGFEGKELLAFVKEQQDEEKRRVDEEKRGDSENVRVKS
jgi:hypothetical protein